MKKIIKEKLSKPKLIRIPSDVMKNITIIASKEKRSIPMQIDKFLELQLSAYKKNKGIRIDKNIKRSPFVKECNLVRIPPNILNEIVLIVDEEFRTIPAQIEMFLKYQIMAYEKKNGIGENK